MNEAESNTPQIIVPGENHAKLPRARFDWWLLLLIPALIAAGVGYYRWHYVPVGGTVNEIRLTNKAGLGGDAAAALATIKPGTPDLYIKLITRDQIRDFEPYKNTPIGNGLTWMLKSQIDFNTIERIDVFNSNAVLKDSQLDRITINDWQVDGEEFHVDLLGQKNQPPEWALPTMIAGCVVGGLILLRFVWKQVI